MLSNSEIPKVIRSSDTTLLKHSADLYYTIFAIALGLFVGWIDLQVTEVTITILALLLSGFLFGFLRPKMAWRWGLCIVMGIPIWELAALLFEMKTAEPVQIDYLVYIAACIFSLSGSYIGVLLGRIFRSS